MYFGWWGPIWFCLYLINIPIVGFLLGYITPLCCLGTFAVSAVTAAIETILLWSAYHLLSGLLPSSGLQIANELGRFEHSSDEGWKFRSYSLSHKTGLDMNGSSPHILVVGGSQTGKSTTMKIILLKLLGENYANVILDYHGEYGFLADKGFRVIDVRNYNPLAPNYDGEPFEDIVSDFVETFLVAFETAGDVQLAILKKKLEENASVAAAHSSISKDAAAARSFTEKDRLAGLSLRLEKIIRYAGGKQALRQLTGEDRNVVFDFSGIRDRDAADFYAENILRRYMALLISAKQPTNIIIDEAHRLNTKSLAERGVETSTARLAREAGKFGGRLIVASQNLTDFTPGFAANFGNILCFRSPAGSDLQVLEHMTGIGLGQLQSVMNGLQRGQALLIGPHSHYAMVKISVPEAFPQPRPKRPAPVEPVNPETAKLPETGSQPAAVSSSGPRTPRSEEILLILEEEGALTATGLSRLMKCPQPAVFRHLKSLTKKGKVIRYEETETPEGREVFYEINDPHRQESSFHQVLISKVGMELERFGTVKLLGGWNSPDLVFNEKTAVEVETGTKPELGGFVEQVEKRFGQGYGAVIVVVINQKQKARYEKVLEGSKNIFVLKFTELAKAVIEK